MNQIIQHIKLIVCILLFSSKIFAQTDSAVQLHLWLANNDTIATKLPKKLHPDSVIQYAYSFMGDRYRRGGTSSKGFDCSGYTMTVYKHFNIKLPHTSA
ncbi:MAG: C40 family peptidase, partial [Bacteroidia bacterium]|nr:C40 family peptidase [Bacteroidia bacterium]